MKSKLYAIWKKADGKQMSDSVRKHLHATPYLEVSMLTDMCGTIRDLVINLNKEGKL